MSNVCECCMFGKGLVYDLSEYRYGYCDKCYSDDCKVYRLDLIEMRHNYLTNGDFLKRIPLSFRPLLMNSVANYGHYTSNSWWREKCQDNKHMVSRVNRLWIRHRGTEFVMNYRWSKALNGYGIPTDITVLIIDMFNSLVDVKVKV
jgi:hypothetical protein